MKTALLSVYHKDGIINFAKQLIELGWNIIASEGTAKALASADIPVRDVAELIRGSAILDHRVVTLSREVHAGLLATDSANDVKQLADLGIPRIDMVCVDFYPIYEAINDSNSTAESVIEKTDIGGPAMLRSGAKGRRIVICDPGDRQMVIDWLKDGEPCKNEFITSLAAKTEAVVAEYGLASARYHSGGDYDGFVVHNVMKLRYGENPWQTPAALLSKRLLSTQPINPLSLENFKPIAGIDPGFVNMADIDRLIQTITHIAAVFDVNYQVPLIAVACKHGNPCGAAIGCDPVEVIKKMVSGDTQAIFGGIVMTNFIIHEKEAPILLKHLLPEKQRRLLHTVIAPEFDKGATETLKGKRNTCRLLKNPALYNLNRESLDFTARFRPVRDNDCLRQPNYTFVFNLKDPQIERIGKILTPEQEKDLLLAWSIGATSNSNTITIVNKEKLIGNGVGQKDRVGACSLAVLGAKNNHHDINGAVAYSDSFFPFPDGPKILADAGVKVIFASSGSIRDKEIKTFCKERNLTLILIPDKVGRGFFNH